MNISFARFWPRHNAEPLWNATSIIREELFSVERLEAHARSLAAAQVIESRPSRGHSLSARLASNGEALLRAYQSISQAVEDGHAITPAAEWLIDNYHLVERQFREVRSDLPPGYYRQLPKLSAGPFIGYPRVFGLAWAFVAHADSRFDAEILRRVILAYQEVEPLTIGELWALSITLRIVLVENLRRLTDLIVASRVGRKQANDAADRLLGAGGRAVAPVALVLAEWGSAPVSDAFAVQILQRLRDQDARIIPALAWLEASLAARATTPDRVVIDEHARQGSATVTISNIINSLRIITHVDWADVFESVSLVDRVLAADPTFALMDFATRNLYRGAIEDISRGSGLPELEIARRSLTAAQAVDAGSLAKHREAGYFLVGGGRTDFERSVHFKAALAKLPERWLRQLGVYGYLLALLAASLGFLAGAMAFVFGSGMGAGWLAFFALLAIIPLSDSAIALVNCAIGRLVAPKVLPALALKEAVPVECRTLLAVPTLLTSIAGIASDVENLEVHHLASPEGEIYFALLSDWADAVRQSLPEDAALLAAAAAGIAALNRRYPPGPAGPRFLLLHRERRWNASEQSWIGWERKRGKLHQLNQFLRGSTEAVFLATEHTTPLAPPGVRYVLTLDADTRLPRETVRRLIGKMAHPLNKPIFDTRLGRVIDGYGILQPRVAPSLPGADGGSLYQRTFSSPSGIDPYAAAASDTYQDLFDEGSYAGKGIYDIDAFERALAGRVPESAMLSHDLFEGEFSRSALASDIEVVEGFPARYDISAMRHHRWTRGDWQLLPWILGLNSAVGGKGGLSAIGRWKMIDNLRRSLSPPLAVAALIAGWFLPMPEARAWTLTLLAAILTPTLIPILFTLAPPRAGVPWAAHLRSVATDFSFALTQSFLRLAFLADQACLMADAIARTLHRLLVTRKRLLEWVSHAQTAIGPHPGLPVFAQRMVGGVTLGLLTGAVALIEDHGVVWLAAPFALLWIGSPAIALWASLSPTVAGRPFAALWAAFPGVARWASLSPVIAGHLPINAGEATELRRTARRTWRFFETFVTAADHHLPPDNFQEEPTPATAHRTSPTNIGLYLLSVVSARDLGWITTEEAVKRLEASFATLQAMEHMRGHLYNWYDTRTLQPLAPKYISTVDSGNLAGHLIALSRACLEWSAADPAPELRMAGAGDAIALARLALAGIKRPDLGEALEHSLRELETEIARAPQAGEQAGARLTALCAKAQPLVVAARSSQLNSESLDLLFWMETAARALQALRDEIDMTESARAALAARLEILAAMARDFALAMEFGFLLDPKRKLLSIGFMVQEGELDSSCYDLLASEARLASFFAIAKGDIPARHWFRLGRAVVLIARRAALISWSGSMFEYLMPSLVMRAPLGSLIEQTSRLIVRRQIDYAAGLHAPWGISESAYNVRDLEMTYQYSNFGVPGLGLKRGLEANIVIAPYATALAAMVDPQAAIRNFARLSAAGALGAHGFYEALDYTPIRLPEGKRVAIVKAYMAHHQGMTIVAIANALSDGAMRTRFHAEPMVQATELLLQERPPRDVTVERRWDADAKSPAKIRYLDVRAGRRFSSAHPSFPATHLLSNGQYSVMLTSAGSGYSRWGDIAISRWREDATCDNWGSFIYLRDLASGAVWSAGAQPVGAEPDQYDVIFNEDRALFTRRDGTLTTNMEVLVSGEDNAEVRYISIANSGFLAREIEVTSFAELALTKQAVDLAHPAFAKMFVQTEYVADVDAIIATRRRRTPEEPEIWAAHLVVTQGEIVGAVEVETDRARFLGRNRSAKNPIALQTLKGLDGSTGAVLDPAFVLRQKVRVAPGGVVRLAFWTMAAASRADLMDCIDKHRDSAAFARAVTLAWSQAQVQLHHIGVDAAEAALFQRLAGHLLYCGPGMRAGQDAIERGAGGQPGLWSLSISGDLPILLVRIAEEDQLGLVRQLLLAHEYWRMKHYSADLVILNERGSSYVQDLHVAIEGMVRASQSRRPATSGNASGGIFVVRADLMTAETRALLVSVARVVVVGQRGSLADQLDRVPDRAASPAPKPVAATAWMPYAVSAVPPLEFFNGHGGFGDNGREYVVILKPGQSTPAPWINVIANPSFGFQVAAEGGGYTWSINSRENQLTPWSNDPVTDRCGEAIYLRDEASGEIWSATAAPIRDAGATYVARHGRGYSRFEHASHEIAVDLTQWAPMDDPVKISRLTLRNLSDRPRRLSITAYVEWVLGPSRGAAAPFLITALDSVTKALFARNAWTPAFAARVAFFDMAGAQTEWTGDRREFLGRNGDVSHPALLASRAQFSGKVGAGLDPCGAMRSFVTLPAGGSATVVILLGQADQAQAAQELVAKYRTADLDAVLHGVKAYWESVVETIQVKTPDRSMDLMLNGWLLYQTLACRVWARAAFYQASGAYGFRDQLQDGMALASIRPDLSRAHLLRAAGRQFVEGDVQHWWWPNTGQGVRTRITDDRAWLAYAAAQYIETTGDLAILDETTPFLEGQKLREDETDAMFQPWTSDESASLYAHCALALDQSLTTGAHGLPLIGSGDWNDGMNSVGEKGKGESVWLAWLHCATLTAFAPLAQARGETGRATTWRQHAEALKAALEENAWDGAWYKRGFYDDGEALGSAASAECRIDAIAQSWAVISGVGDPDRAKAAMAAVDRELILPGENLALLFKPPFDSSAQQPGYIKGYPPGVRENGGQYTHGAIWSIIAFAMLGEGDKAARLFGMLNPINHARSAVEAERYKVEAYVIAADVYANPQHLGRGGWTWYTGSAGWMQRAGVENILGLRVLGGRLHLNPCIPAAWPGFSISLKHRSARYEIIVENPYRVSAGIAAATLDSVAISGRPLNIALTDDGAAHRLMVSLGGPEIAKTAPALAFALRS